MDHTCDHNTITASEEIVVFYVLELLFNVKGSWHLATELHYIALTLPSILKFLSETIISPEDAPVLKIDEITT